MAIIMNTPVMFGKIFLRVEILAILYGRIFNEKYD
jgi:hypothetical protein